MKITSKDALKLFLIVNGTLNVQGRMGGYDQQQRLDIINRIIDYQDTMVHNMEPDIPDITEEHGRPDTETNV